jgi:hypothetical protein
MLIENSRYLIRNLRAMSLSLTAHSTAKPGRLSPHQFTLQPFQR